MSRLLPLILLLATAAAPPSRPAEPPARPRDIFARQNLVAWCIVPFDAKQRTPAQRAEMLERIGVKRFAYDWREQHLASFEQELQELARRRIELTAVWFPGALDRNARLILDLLRKHKLRPQLWVIIQASSVEQGCEALRPIAREAAAIGSRVALYNHGGWFGEPENQIAIIERLARERITNVGIVYNLHHGHDHVDRFPKLLEVMKPHLLALNLNGMTAAGDRKGRKILPLGQGELDVRLLKAIRESGWQGPVGILNHTDEDAEGRLLDNLDGLAWLLPQLDAKPAGTRPKLRTF
jgi:hypothetical protein